MKDREYEGLDIHEMERRVAVALIALVDAPGERQRITPKLLSARTNLPPRLVREITDDWNLPILSGDAYWLRSGSLERARALCGHPAPGSD